MNSESLHRDCPDDDALLAAVRGKGKEAVTAHLKSCGACRMRAEMMREFEHELSRTPAVFAPEVGVHLVDEHIPRTDLALAAVIPAVAVRLVRSMHTEDGTSVLRILHDGISDCYEFWLLAEKPVEGTMLVLDGVEMLLDAQGHAAVPSARIPDIEEAEVRVVTPVAVFDLNDTIRESLLAEGRFVFEGASLPPMVIEFSREGDEEVLVLRLAAEETAGTYRVAVCRAGAETTFIGPIARKFEISGADTRGMRLLFYVE